jgi:DNA-directed RNA polymerase beta' subunit
MTIITINDPEEELLQEVTSPKPFEGKSKLINEDGLLSERIFGPQQSYKCKCGKLNTRTYDRGKRCPKCNVLCDSNELRLTTFAKITLPFGAIKPTKKKQFYKIVGKSNANLLNPVLADHSVSIQRYLAIQADAKKLKIVNELKYEPNWYNVPFRITGIYTLMLVLKYLAFYLKLDIAKQYFDNRYIMRYIKVLPPEVRPIIPLSNQTNKLKITEVNKSYESLINLNRVNRPFINNLQTDEEHWLGLIHNSFKNRLFDDELVERSAMDYDIIAARYQYYVNMTYANVYGDICGKTGYIRSSILGKTIEFSARSVIKVDPSLPPYKVGVSKKILFKLWYPYYCHFMTTVKKKEFDNVYENYISKNIYDKKSFDEFLDWFLKEDK